MKMKRKTESMMKRKTASMRDVSITSSSVHKMAVAKTQAKHQLSPLPLLSPSYAAVANGGGRAAAAGGGMNNNAEDIKTNTSSSFPQQRDAEHFNLNFTIVRTPKAGQPYHHNGSTASPGVQSISDARRMISTALESFKRGAESSYSAILKELDASAARLSKRLKMQMQTNMKLGEEAEEEFNKLSARLNDDLDEIQVTCTELVAESHSAGNRILKNSIPELQGSIDKRVEGLRSRYGVRSISFCCK